MSVNRSGNHAIRQTGEYIENLFANESSGHDWQGNTH